MFKKFISYYKPHKKLFILDMSSAFIMALIDLVFPMFTRKFLNDIIPSGAMRTMIIFGGSLLLLYIIHAGLNFIVNYWGHVVGTRMEYDMRKDLFSHLQLLSFSFYDANRTGKIMSRMINDLREISELAHHGPEDIFLSVIMLVGASILLAFIEWRLALVLIILGIFMFIFAIKKRASMSNAFKEVKEKIAVVNADLENSISGIRVAQSFTNEEYEKSKFDQGNTLFKNATSTAYKKMSEFITGVGFISNFMNLAVLIYGGYLVYAGNITIADLLAFLLYIGLILTPIRRLTGFIQQFESGMTGFARFYEILETNPEITDDEDAIDITDVKGNVIFDHVTFSYDNKEHILKELSLEIRPGETVAIAGPSGGGKTTLCNLIPRFYSVDQGKIYIDGHDIEKITLKSLRYNIGIVQQDVFLFAGTIGDNILYGKPEASYEDLVTASKKAQIHEFIMSLPEKYNTYVGERGIRLSGGQKQRVSIARAFLKNPPILILDEATSSLDNKTEKEIQAALDTLAVGRTTLIIAHRLSTIQNADRILVVTQKGIEEQGTHQELIELNGIYAHLHKESC
ncbi:MAG: ABC transporter ATP-binding protein [Clostridia bacterium]|nr:ABC transporter ATP-binding protein [Clostridia bacterium]